MKKGNQPGQMNRKQWQAIATPTLLFALHHFDQIQITCLNFRSVSVNKTTNQSIRSSWPRVLHQLEDHVLLGNVYYLFLKCIEYIKGIIERNWINRWLSFLYFAILFYSPVFLYLSQEIFKIVEGRRGEAIILVCRIFE